ncbi:MAG: hypothetical protein WD691_02550 [Acidimicrobiales bacterium]
MTALPLDTPAAPDAHDQELTASLQSRLAERLAALRRRTGGPAALDQRIAWIGGTMAAAGAVLVLLGWYGASQTSRVYLQIPYLISGGLFGVVLAFTGGCAYLASWLTRLVHDQRTRADEAIAAATATASALERIEALLAGGTATRDAVGADGSLGLVATPSGKLAHRPSCASVVGRTDLRPATVGRDGFGACRMCDAGTD